MPPKKPLTSKAPAKTTTKPAAKTTAAKTGVKPPAKNAVKKTAGKAAPKGKQDAASNKKADKPKEKVWTKDDEAARKIQTGARGYLARKKLKALKKEKADYDELMDKLEKEALIQVVRMQQEEAERQQAKEDEERRQRIQEKKRQKRMLESAFDGDVDDMEAILKEVGDIDDKNGIGRDDIGTAIRNKHLLNIVECEDANENTPLSEASSGGSMDAVKFLIERGADPNHQGQFLRTPLYRAAFAGHLDVCQMLLQHGADPRIYASDGQSPQHIASLDAVVELLTEWDISQTESLKEKIDREKEKRSEQEKKRREAETNKLEGSLAEIQKEFESKQKHLNSAYCELNKRITEHDTVSAQGFERTDITLQCIHDQEAVVNTAQLDFEVIQGKLQQAKLRLREQQMNNAELGDDLPGLKVTVRELDDVLVRDVGNKIKDSGKWPMIIDRTGHATTFLRYQDTNYVNAINPQFMDKDKLRLALLGAIRYGKPFVIDMMELDLWEQIEMRMNDVEAGLLKSILDKSIIQNEKYLSLLRDTDGDDYSRNRFTDLRTSNFKFVLITKNPYPSKDMIENFYVIRTDVSS
ncbi:unnamed protein product [Owenia fusiformis]|uniref:Uncharacterized protein n=1 Tax=Owenia fusiformis TaxID=6347 RepID=A0A8J1XZL0_OWEFU|nr:unnamed protein product [Owenia fusiformis]